MFMGGRKYAYLLVDDGAESGLALDNGVWDTHLPAKSREEDDELAVVQVEVTLLELGLKPEDKIGDEAELENENLVLEERLDVVLVPDVVVVDDDVRDREFDAARRLVLEGSVTTGLVEIAVEVLDVENPVLKI